MKRGQQLIAIVLAMSLSLLAIPAAKALPESAEEYLVRLATGTLYIPYTALGRDKPHAEPEKAPAVLTDEEERLPEEGKDSQEVAIPQNAIAVQAVNLSRLEVTDTPALLLSNETKFAANLTALSKKDIDKKRGAVLIIHTHGTESYLPDGVEYYTEDEDFRSTDRKENVVAVGAAFADVLRDEGIQVYHDTTMYDENTFNNAYTASRTACRQWLKDHPEISYIIDIHRDAVTDGDGKGKKTICTVNSEEIAQVMLVIGTNEAGANHPCWEKNLTLAVKYQELLNAYPTFARPIYLRRASFNQQLSSGSMLLEVGSAANTITEAKAAARLAAERFALLYWS